MPLAEATAVAADRARPAACCYQRYDSLSSRNALVALATWCERFSPVVGLEETAHPESLFLDVTGLGPSFGGEPALVERVARELRAQGWQIRLALADTLGAAWAAAHYAEAAGTRAGMIIAPGESLSAVADLPTAALRLSAEEVRLLADLGLVQIGQLDKLPRPSLATRFGPELLRRWDQLTGAAEEVIRAETISAALEATWPFEQPVAQAGAIEAVIERLLERLTGMLLREERGVLRLECELLASSRQQAVGRGQKNVAGADTRMRVPISVGLMRPSAAPRYLFELLRMQLDRLRLTEPVAGIRIAVTKTELLECHQGELFEISAGRDDPRALAMLVDRLSSRLGRQCVLHAQLSSDPQPEEACRYQPLVGNEPSRRFDRRMPGRRGAGRHTDRRSPRGKNKEQVHEERHFKWSQRPLRLAPAPIPLTVVAVVPDGPLLWFTLGHERRHVARSWGPERIETGWWRGRGVRRDYYRVETTDGHRHWLFRRRSDGQWFWHGDFD